MTTDTTDTSPEASTGATETDVPDIQAPDITVVPIDDIRPYWRNPRRIGKEAIDAVADSITKYGYRQPMVIDEDKVIITGHTRYAALRRLGVTHVPVIIAADLPAAKVREYRVLDNRVGEFSEWDDDALILELREFEATLVDAYFPDVDLQMGDLSSDAFQVTEKDMDDATAKATSTTEYKAVETTQIICPSCFHEFDVKTDTL